MLFPLLTIFLSILFYLYPTQKIGVNTLQNYDYYLILKPGESYVGDLSSIRDLHCINYIEIHRRLYNEWQPRLLHRRYPDCNASYNFYGIYIIANDTEVYDETDNLQMGRKYEYLNDTKKAISYYELSRKSLRNEVIFYSLYRLAVLHMKEELFLKAYHFNPHRKEPLYYLTRFARTRGNYTQCLLYARSGLLVGSPSIHELYVEKAIYNYALLEEFRFCLHHSGRVYEGEKVNVLLGR